MAGFNQNFCLQTGFLIVLMKKKSRGKTKLEIKENRSKIQIRFQFSILS